VKLSLLLSLLLLGCARAAPVEAPVQERGAPAAPRPDERAAAAAPEAAPAGAEGWVADEAIGVALARRTGKPVLLTFDAAWCTACRELDRETFPSPDVQVLLRKVVAIRADVTDGEAPESARLLEKYGVIGLPTLLILDRNGNEVARATEFIRPKALAAMLAKALP
jgi:thiol:disulfide interchange protein DsbD